jgi:1-aminocyclopropane-1-carboxylate deaminase
MSFNLNTITEPIKLLNNFDIELYLKREDKIHPFISGNKYRKLKYNLIEARNQNKTKLLTFGGAFSNHIAAVAAAGKNYNFSTVGIIRGEELFAKISENSTLSFAQNCGMELKFITREQYRDKTSLEFINALKNEFSDFYLVPEGGTNELAVKGCEEIITNEDMMFDYICCPVGTGGTISGLINASSIHQKILGFPVLKGDFLQNDISKFALKSNWELATNYHFGGYAKINKELVEFINSFKVDYNIQLDPVYTGKMMYGILDLIAKNKFQKGTKILAIHTGGLQGIEGMNQVLKQKKMPLIKK